MISNNNNDDKSNDKKKYKIYFILAGFLTLLVLPEFMVVLGFLDSEITRIYFAYLFLALTLAILFYLFYHTYLREIYIAKKKTFRCKRCGHCCRLKVKLNRYDIEKLKENGLKKYISNGYLKQINGYCPFLTLKKGLAGCNIYNNRPDICRKFPEKRIFGLKAYDIRCKRLQDTKF